MESHQVIDLNGALEQCGDDREFLVELLNDLNAELTTQITKIGHEFEKNVHGVDVPRREESIVVIQRAAHVIKGAAANLMCEELRVCATNVEAAAKAARGDLLYDHYQKLNLAAVRFVEFVNNQS